MTTTQTTNSLDLAEDGRIILSLEDGPITLKVPKVKEYKALRETHAQTNAAIATWAEQEQDDDYPEVTPERFEPSEFFGPLILQIIETLGDKPAPGVDDMPAWLVESSQPLNLMFQHWRSVPLGRGGQVPPR